jgi:hypothetical protein
MPEDRIEREIEEILNKLDHFPEESKTDRLRRRSSDAAASFLRPFIEPLTRISLRHVMLAGIVMVVIAFFARGLGPLMNWVLIAGLLLFLSAFALSFFNGGATKPPRIEKRWRGRPMDLEEPHPPSLGERFRAWLRRGQHR